jgi:nucleotide-binding universal stress UspA family protein
MPYQRIILAIDQDDVSSQALLKAIQLAKKLQAELKIIHVVDEVIITRLKEEAVEDEDLKSAEQPSIDFLKHTMKIAQEAGVCPETQLIKVTTKNQHIAFEIVDAAKDWSADLIIIGAHSRSGIHKLLLGHIAESIMRITYIPVLLVHTQPKN